MIIKKLIEIDRDYFNELSEKMYEQKYALIKYNGYNAIVKSLHQVKNFSFNADIEIYK
jgi:hypothetical protein